MLRYLFFVDVAFAILGASMIIGVGVSALLIGWYLDSAPEYRGMVLSLLQLTAAYVVLTLAAATAGWGLHRKARWHWWAQACFAVTAVLGYLFSIRMLANN